MRVCPRENGSFHRSLTPARPSRLALLHDARASATGPHTAGGPCRLPYAGPSRGGLGGAADPPAGLGAAPRFFCPNECTDQVDAYAPGRVAVFTVPVHPGPTVEDDGSPEDNCRGRGSSVGCLAFPRVLFFGCHAERDPATGMPSMERLTAIALVAICGWIGGGEGWAKGLPVAHSPFAQIAADVQPTDTSRAEGDRTKGNRVLIVNSGYDALLLRVHLIRQAVRTIDIQTFIWTNDECGRFLMYELIAAAKRGVRVRIIADHFVSDKDPGIVAFLATVNPNLQIKHYRPAAKRINPKPYQVLFQAAFGFRDFNQRMHNKIVLVDDAVAITGGRNIENSYYNHSTGMTFKDRDVLVVGPVLADVRRSFARFWDYRHSVSSRELRDVAKLITAGRFERYTTREDFAFNGLFRELMIEADDAKLITARFVSQTIPAQKVRFLADRPGKNRSLWLRGGGRASRVLAQVIGEARRELIIQSPYFVVSEEAEKVFRAIRAKQPELDVTISTNSFGSTDNTVAYSANYRLRSLYIESLGFRAYEYKPHPEDLRRVFPAYDVFEKRASLGPKPDDAPEKPFLCIHAKSFVMDGRVSFIGSFNLDPRSVNLNTEVGFLITDPVVARELRRDILTDTAPRNSWVINRKQMPLGLEEANSLLEGFVRKTPLDLWPIRNTSSFELIDGREAVPPDHPEFYDRYRDIGPFPGAKPGWTAKQITTRIYKAVFGMGIPLF